MDNLKKSIFFYTFSPNLSYKAVKKIILPLVITISLGVMSSCHNQELNCTQELQKIEKEYDEKLLNASDDEEKQIDLLGEKLLKLDELECV